MSIFTDAYVYTQPVTAAEVMATKDIRLVYTSNNNGGKIKFLGILLKLLQLAKDELKLCETIQDKMCWIDDIGFLERLQFKIERDLAAYKYRNDYFMREVDVSQKELDEAQSLETILCATQRQVAKKKETFRKRYNESKSSEWRLSLLLFKWKPLSYP